MRAIRIIFGNIQTTQPMNNLITILSVFLFSLLFISCNSSGGGEQPTETPVSTALIPSGDDDYKLIQTALISVQPGGTVELGEGTFKLSNTLSLDGIDDVTIKGAGMEKTLLDFAGQTSGAEGIKVTANNFTIEDVAIIDSKGDGIKVQDADGVIFRRLRVEWTGDGDSLNGAYGVYPVTCRNILMENCIARGASDAGIYVGQSENAIVRNNLVERNVAGIEIENTLNSECYGNTVQNNTAGILIFDLPDLPKKNGKNYRIYNNIVKENNHPNFSSMGISVSMIPAGVGLLFMACQNVEAYDNVMTDNISVGTAIFNLDQMGRQTEDSLYDKYPSAIHLYNNTYSRSKSIPDTTRAFGKVLFESFGTETPVILFDGFYNKDLMVDGEIPEDLKICIHDNKGATFFNMNTHGTDADEHACKLDAVPPVTFDNEKLAAAL